jgi:hypothetical protein
MSKFFKTASIPTLVFGATAFVALVSATSVTPAAAQGVPAGLLRLDSSQPSALAEVQQDKVRNTYAHVARKHHNPAH